jgi:hypothetical protein
VATFYDLIVEDTVELVRSEGLVLVLGIRMELWYVLGRYNIDGSISIGLRLRAHARNRKSRVHSEIDGLK